MTGRGYILFMKEVKRDRDTEKKVTYKLPKEKYRKIFYVFIFSV